MLERITHRGPDGDGSGIALVHRRLAILDLSRAAKQIMTTDDGHFTLAYNGEVYNFRDLRKNLEPKIESASSLLDLLLPQVILSLP